MDKTMTSSTLAKYLRPGSLGRILFGAVLGAIGIVLCAGGGWLLPLGGSGYYFVIGILLTLSGVLTIRARPLGVLVYAIAFGVTVVWWLWEACLRPCGLPPRSA